MVKHLLILLILPLPIFLQNRAGWSELWVPTSRCHAIGYPVALQVLEALLLFLVFFFFFYLGKGPVMFNFETRSNFICMPGIFSTKGTSQLLAWRGLMPTVAVESRLYFPVGSVWGLTLGSQMCTQLLKLCLYNWGEAVTGTQQNQRNVF